MNKRHKTLIQIRNTQSNLDITPNDLVYMVDETVSKATTIKELIDYFGKNINLTREDGSLYIIAKQSDGSSPTLRYNPQTKSWQFSNDGSEFVELDKDSRIASENTLGTVKVKKGGGLSIDEEGALSIDEDFVIPKSITFSYSDLSRVSYYKNGEPIVKYSFKVNSIKLFEIIETCDDESYYIEPASKKINFEDKSTELIWLFNLNEDESKDFYFKKCSWKVNFGR